MSEEPLVVHNDVQPHETNVLDSHTLNIVPDKASYTVVIKKSSPGDPWTGYPILKFKISGGTAGQKVDVQTSRDSSAAALSGGPGLNGSWKHDQTRTDRAGKKLFSSWTNGDTITLNSAGKAEYTMPKEWWRDLARIPLSQYATDVSGIPKPIDLYYRAVAVDNSSTIKARSHADGSGAQVKIYNNLVKFEVVEHGYINSGVQYSVTMKFTVREANTTEMYTIVQWMKGENPVWDSLKHRSYALHEAYGLLHKFNFPEWAIDRLRTNPRYWDGSYTIAIDGKTASATDKPGGPIGPRHNYDFYKIDFETKLHLDFEVPASVHIKRKDGASEPYGVIIGILSDPQPITLASDTWKARILQKRGVGLNVTTTHPDTYAGP